jgi:hypothetical protein
VIARDVERRRRRLEFGRQVRPPLQVLDVRVHLGEHASSSLLRRSACSGPLARGGQVLPRRLELSLRGRQVALELRTGAQPRETLRQLGDPPSALAARS